MSHCKLPRPPRSKALLRQPPPPLRRVRKTFGDFSLVAGQEMQRSLDASPLPKVARQWVAQRVQVLNHAVRGVMQVVPHASADTRKAATIVEASAQSTIDSVRRAATFGQDSILLDLPRYMNSLQLSKRQRRELDKILKTCTTPLKSYIAAVENSAHNKPSGSMTRPSTPLPTGTSTMARVRLTVSPSLIVRVGPKITRRHCRLEVQRHALDAARKLDHLAGLDVVEAVDARDAVAHSREPGRLRSLRLRRQSSGFRASGWPKFLRAGCSWRHVLFISFVCRERVAFRRADVAQFPLIAARMPVSLVPARN